MNIRDSNTSGQQCYDHTVSLVDSNSMAIKHWFQSYSEMDTSSYSMTNWHALLRISVV